MELVVKVERMLEDRSGTSNGRNWRFASFLCETVGGNRPEKIVFEVTDDEKQRIQQFEAAVDRVVKVVFSVSARLSNNRWFNTVRAWSITNV